MKTFFVLAILFTFSLAALNETQKDVWQKAFDAERTHLAAQRKFHTSELERYDNRDKEYPAEKAAFDKEYNTCRDRAKGVHKEWRTYHRAEGKLNVGINRNQRARNPLRKARNQAARTAYRQHRMLTLLRKLAATCPEECNKHFEEYQKEAQTANDSEKAFHHVEFREFEEREKCLKATEAAIKEGKDQRELRKTYGGCMRTVQQTVKRAVVNVADNKRRVDRKNVGKEYWKWYKCGMASK